MGWLLSGVMSAANVLSLLMLWMFMSHRTLRRLMHYPRRQLMVGSVFGLVWVFWAVVIHTQFRPWFFFLLCQATGVNLLWWRYHAHRISDYSGS